MAVRDRSGIYNHGATTSERGMVYKGHIKNGQIVLEGEPVLPEGAEVEVSLAAEDAGVPEHGAMGEGLNSLQKLLLEFAGTVNDLPPDMSDNHDHYLYGAPKRKP